LTIPQLLDSASDSDEEGLDEDLLENIKESIDSLHDLALYIEEFLSDSEERAKSSTLKDVAEDVIQLYTSEIMRRFDYELQPELLETLVKHSLLRHQRLRGWAKSKQPALGPIVHVPKETPGESEDGDELEFPDVAEALVTIVPGEPFTCNICYRQIIFLAETGNLEKQWQ
jgi:hypothetical protein